MAPIFAQAKYDWRNSTQFPATSSTASPWPIPRARSVFARRFVTAFSCA